MRWPFVICHSFVVSRGRWLTTKKTPADKPRRRAHSPIARRKAAPTLYRSELTAQCRGTPRRLAVVECVSDFLQESTICSCCQLATGQKRHPDLAHDPVHRLAGDCTSSERPRTCDTFRFRVNWNYTGIAVLGCPRDRERCFRHFSISGRRANASQSRVRFRWRM